MLNRQDRLYRRQKMRLVLKWVIIASMAFVTMFLISQIYNHTVKSFNRHNREIVETRSGVMEQTCQADAIILNDEKTYYAPCEGYFENSICEGERVRIGSKAGVFAPVNGQRVTVMIPATGIYTRHTDGLEKVFADVDVIEPGPEAFKYQVRVYDKNGHYYEGDPVFKIVNNIRPAEMVVRLAEAPPAVIHKNDSLVIRYGKQELGKAQVQKVQHLNNNYYIYLKCQEYNQLLTKCRRITITMVFDYKEGIIIPVRALKSKDGQKGVFCIKDEETSFKTVNVLEQQDGMALVEGLGMNEMIVLNAR